MTDFWTISVSTELDIMAARMKVRDLARQIGMGTTDQARLAMATSSMAAQLGLGGSCEGHIAIESVHANGRTGIRVICFETEGHAPPPPSEAVLHDARWMVDEIKVEDLPAQRLRVTLVKWL